MIPIRKHLVIFAFTSSLFTSCLKDVSLAPPTFQPITFTTADQLDEQLAGAYNLLTQDQLYAQGLWGYLTAGADESWRSNATTSTLFPELYNASAGESVYWNFWRQLYKGIEDANIILDVADVPDMPERKREQVIGQATFLRAYYFYLLVNYFGDVPLKTQLATEIGTNFNLPRDDSKKIYDFIITEMTKAEPLVPTMAEVQSTTYVTQGAVQAMLARVCLKMAGYPLLQNDKFAQALAWSQKLIQSNVHSLNPDYSRTFINNMENNMKDRNTKEGIWDAAFLSKSNTSGSYSGTGYLVLQQLGNLMGVYNPDASATSVAGYSSAAYRPYPKLFDLYAPGDLRRDWNIAPYSYKNITTTKYPYLEVVFTGGGGTGAKATAKTAQDGSIISIEIDNPGTGYTSEPAITFNTYKNSAVALPAIPPQAVTVTANKATATATISGGKITAITVTKPGLGYATIYDRGIGKWRREYEINPPPVRQQNYTSCNFPILRYADVLLMAAEADLKVNGAPSAKAVGYFNQVKRRAFGYDPLTASPVDVSTFTFQDIVDERSRELCFEGQRRNDLIRWGIMTTAMQTVFDDNTNRAPTAYLTAANMAANNFLTAPDKYVLFPIPSSEMALDKALTQNNGW
ncbi:RagB/SusD family nutrient uptake outer membrane protein [Paraflavitalea soli]|uniref:RagB/SusD family nutrient uptake outer membrane protein n=1 Tax=Paraflavitalea soli TaxID=2315862 RepID=A0A3B7MEQ1_9BACT|nr:RagB/SusD family nutrient uptake outer membrane protein [Paraflavitalea soli]AXY72818.1 RagB/SusD family nutrient uptake outer membrane protein [Paraflavitalea soli]